jgi:NAD(P)-dependent dehydrogenase (short-subunit alcohol dehydrogenase family)
MPSTAEPGVSGRVALVSGAAQGIGEATARRLAQDGTRLVLTDLTEDVVSTAARIAEDFPASRAIGIRADVTELAATDHLVATAVETFGQLDTLIVSGAVLQKRGPLAELDPGEWNRVMANNARAPFLLCRSAIPALPRPGGSIVLLASFAGQRGITGYSAYCSSKAAVLLLTQSLALELAEEGIRVNAIAPAHVESAMGREDLERAARSRGISEEEAQRERDSFIPMRRQASAAEVAECMAFLCSPASSYMTGACLDVNGGVVLR